MDEIAFWTLIDASWAGGNAVEAKLLLGPVGDDSFRRPMSSLADVPADGKADLD